MNKPTDEELNQIAWRAGAEDRDRALHDAGIAHGWREAIEALRAVADDKDPVLYVDPVVTSTLADHLERIAKERGY